MAFDRTDIQIDHVLHSTNLISDGHQTMHDQAMAQYQKNLTMGEATFSGRVAMASASTGEAVHQHQQSALVPLREDFESSLHSVANLAAASQDSAVHVVSEAVSGLGGVINPGI